MARCDNGTSAKRPCGRPKGAAVCADQDFRADRIVAKPIQPEDDKIVRMSAASLHIEAGAVLLPQSATWLDEFRAELMAFPNGKHDDQADALSQLINWARTRPRYTLDNLY